MSCKVNGTYLSGKAKSGTDTFKNLGFLIYFMKIMKAFDKKVGEAEYHKYRINLPKKIVEESNLLGKEVKVKLEKGKIIIEKE